MGLQSGRYRETNEHVTDKRLTKSLSDALSKTQCSRETSSCEALLPLGEFDCVVVATFPSSPQNKTQSSALEIARRCVQRSQNEYFADHDALTGLLNRRGLDKALEAIRALTSPPPNPAPLEQPAERSQLFTIELDLDHFKQINDSFGHDYGDIVLQAFARRIESVAETLKSTVPSLRRLEVSRQGGEEFLVLALGTFSKTDMLQVAEEFRKGVHSEPVPSDDDWEYLSNVRPSHSTCPSATDRRLTVSIGVSAPASPNKAALLDEQKRQADIALYRAKATGRNQVCYFPDILTRYGRVLQHHESTNIVAIDIGRLVNVKAGQEFLVYHPEFVGNVPYYVADGRSRRKLGLYPRYPYGRIVAFDVQDDISFCQIAERASSEPFVAGTVLEEIPAGTISHLVEQKHRLPGEPGLLVTEDICKLVEQLASKDQLSSVVVLKIHGFDELVERRGSAHANETLGRVYQNMRSNGEKFAIAQVGTAEIAVAVRNTDEIDVQDWCGKVLAVTGERDDVEHVISAGIYDPASDSKAKGDASTLLHRHGVDYARYAASNGDSDHRVVVFSPLVATQIISRAITTKHHEQGMTDYQRLCALGIDYSWFHNQGAMCALSKTPQDLQTAIQALARAVGLQDDERVLWLNKGYVEYLASAHEHAMKSFLVGFLLSKDKEIPAVYHRSGALSIAAAFRANLAEVDEAFLKWAKELFTQSGGDIAQFNLTAGITSSV